MSTMNVVRIGADGGTVIDITIGQVFLIENTNVREDGDIMTRGNVLMQYVMNGLDQPLVPCHMVNIQSNYAAVTLFVRVVVHVINLGAVKDVRKGHTPMGQTAECVSQLVTVTIGNVVVLMTVTVSTVKGKFAQTNITELTHQLLIKNIVKRHVPGDQTVHDVIQDTVEMN